MDFTAGTGVDGRLVAISIAVVSSNLGIAPRHSRAGRLGLLFQDLTKESQYWARVDVEMVRFGNGIAQTKTLLLDLRYCPNDDLQSTCNYGDIGNVLIPLMK